MSNGVQVVGRNASGFGEAVNRINNVSGYILYHTVGEGLSLKIEKLSRDFDKGQRHIQNSESYALTEAYLRNDYSYYEKLNPLVTKVPTSDEIDAGVLAAEGAGLNLKALKFVKERMEFVRGSLRPIGDLMRDSREKDVSLFSHRELDSTVVSSLGRAASGVLARTGIEKLIGKIRDSRFSEVVSAVDFVSPAMDLGEFFTTKLTTAVDRLKVRFG